jgi:hypothetical protein
MYLLTIQTEPPMNGLAVKDIDGQRLNNPMPREKKIKPIKAWMLRGRKHVLPMQVYSACGTWTLALFNRKKEAVKAAMEDYDTALDLKGEFEITPVLITPLKRKGK